MHDDALIGGEADEVGVRTPGERHGTEDGDDAKGATRHDLSPGGSAVASQCPRVPLMRVIGPFAASVTSRHDDIA